VSNSLIVWLPIWDTQVPWRCYKLGSSMGIH